MSKQLHMKDHLDKGYSPPTPMVGRWDAQECDFDTFFKANGDVWVGRGKDMKIYKAGDRASWPPEIRALKELSEQGQASSEEFMKKSK